MKQHKFIGIFCILLLSLHIQAESISYTEFLHKVAEKNTAYMAEKYNIDIAIANKQAARIFNDPEISFDYGNNQDWDMQMGQSYEVGLSYSIPLGQVRKTRIEIAQNEQAITEAAVADFWSNLRLEAATAYANAWLYKKAQKTAEKCDGLLAEIARIDSVRLSLGDIDKSTAMQSLLEAKQAHSNYLKSKADYQNSLLELGTYIGGEKVTDISDDLITDLLLPTSDLSELQRMALSQRSDLQVALLTKQLSAKNLQLVKAEKAPELTLNAGYVHSTEVKNEIAPAPIYDGFSVGFSLPLAFSSINKGNRQAAESAIQQSDAAYKLAEEQILSQVGQAFYSYKAAENISQTYNAEMLQNAQLILENRIAAYAKGESSIFELLSARQTYEDILSAYYSAEAEAFVAAAVLLRAIGE